MITDFILNIFFALISFLLTPLVNNVPDVVLDPKITASISTASNYLNILDVMFPVGTLIIVFGLFLTVETAIFAYKLIMWLIKKIPTIN